MAQQDSIYMFWLLGVIKEFEFSSPIQTFNEGSDLNVMQIRECSDSREITFLSERWQISTLLVPH